MENMPTNELQRYIAREKERGLSAAKTYLVAYHQRQSEPVAIIILTLIGMSIASRKIRGSMGLHLALGSSIGIILRYIISIFGYFFYQYVLGALVRSMDPKYCILLRKFVRNDDKSKIIDMKKIEITHTLEDDKGKFTLILDGEIVGHMLYKQYNDERIDIKHTEVDSKLRGQGMAAHLVSAAVMHVRMNDLIITSSCSYATRVLGDSKEYADIYRA